MEASVEDGSSEDLVGFLVRYEASLEEQGWDAAPTVLARVPDEGDEMVFDVVGVGDPYELLESWDPAGVSAYVVSVEAWSWPPELPESERVGRPSERPDRIEVRSVMAVTRSGEVIVVSRQRGGEPIIERVAEGPLVDAMTEALQRSGSCGVVQRHRARRCRGPRHGGEP